MTEPMFGETNARRAELEAEGHKSFCYAFEGGYCSCQPKQVPEPERLAAEMLKAAIAYSESIAFWDEQRGYVCYSVQHTLEARKALEQAAFNYGRSLRTQSALENT